MWRGGERTLEEDETQEEQELTLKDIHDLLSEHLSMWSVLSEPESHGDSGMTANLPKTNNAEKEGQDSDDENDPFWQSWETDENIST